MNCNFPCASCITIPKLHRTCPGSICYSAYATIVWYRMMCYHMVCETTRWLPLIRLSEKCIKSCCFEDWSYHHWNILIKTTYLHHLLDEYGFTGYMQTLSEIEIWVVMTKTTCSPICCDQGSGQATPHTKSHTFPKNACPMQYGAWCCHVLNFFENLPQPRPGDFGTKC